jgi:TonB family protein
LASAALAGADAVAQQKTQARLPDLKKALAMPVSPGSIALLAVHAAQPDAQARIGAAIGDATPAVRAAAARVTFVAAMRGLQPQIATALARETHPDAAYEQSRVLAYFGGPEHDSVVLEAAARLSHPKLVSLLASRGTTALTLLPRLRATGASPATLTEFIERATRPDPSVLEGLAATAIKDGDATLLDATLDAAGDSALAISDRTFASALEAPAGSGVPATALWHLLRRRVPPAPSLPQAVVDLADSLRSAPVNQTGDLSWRLALELAARRGGREARSMVDWVARLGDLSPRVRQNLAAVSSLLSAEERSAFGLAGVPSARGGGPGRSGQPPPPASEPNLFRTADGYPPEFVASTLAVTGCDVKNEKTQRSGGGAADVTYREDGRVASVSPLDTGLSRECADAALALLAAHVSTGDRRLERGRLMIPFLTDYLACSASLTTTQTPQAIAPGLASGPTQAPKKIKDVKPIYPSSAQSDRVSGVVIIDSVISARGCVAEARVLRSVDPRLDWAALRGVLQWQFTPTLIDGTPVPIIMSVTVSFKLN